MKPIAPPRLPPPDADDTWPDGGFEARESYCDLDLVEPPFDDARGVSLTRVRIRRGDLAERSLTGLDLDDVTFVECDLSNADLTNASGRRVVLGSSRISGLKLNGARLQETTFRDCQGRYSQFEGAIFKRARFERCALIEANFDQADLTGVVFDGCDLGGATFAGAKLKDTDFRGSLLEASRVKLSELRGAIVTAAQAIALVERETGLVTRPSDDDGR